MALRTCLQPLLGGQGKATFKRILLHQIKCSRIVLNSLKMMSTLEFDTLKVTIPKDHVAQVELNRPKKSNAMNRQFFKDMVACFQAIANDTEIRSVVLCGTGKSFTAGLDLMDYASLFMESSDESRDTARKAYAIKNMVTDMQKSFNLMEECPQPVIAAIHSACIGGGIDMITACDIRLCSSDAWFQIKEVDIGLAADLGTLQRLPKIIGNQSLVRELCYTARAFQSDEAAQCGLVRRIFHDVTLPRQRKNWSIMAASGSNCSCVYPDRDALLEGALSLAEQIAEKSPVAVAGTKRELNYARDHSVQDGLDHVITWNMSMLQSEDVMKAGQAAMTKSKATFSKL